MAATTTPMKMARFFLTRTTVPEKRLGGNSEHGWTRMNLAAKDYMDHRGGGKHLRCRWLPRHPADSANWWSGLRGTEFGLVAVGKIGSVKNIETLMSAAIRSVNVFD
jgi:hypothetical protein